MYFYRFWVAYFCYDWVQLDNKSDFVQSKSQSQYTNWVAQLLRKSNPYLDFQITFHMIHFSERLRNNETWCSVSDPLQIFLKAFNLDVDVIKFSPRSTNCRELKVGF